MFIGCHFTSGENYLDRRNEDFLRTEIELGTPGLLASESVDSTIFLGDMNYRINKPATEILSLVKDAKIDFLYENDELNESMKNTNIFNRYKEGKIEFPPTYKFKKNFYATNRCPSWTDRILYSDAKNLLTQNSYGSLMLINYSDHKPVYSQFTFKI